MQAGWLVGWLNRLVTDELRVPDGDVELREIEQELANAARFDMRATPTERATYRQHAAQLRAVERQRCDERAPTVEALGEKFSWSPAMVWHLVQPYCQCEIGHDGWQWCRHAADEGVDTFGARLPV